MLLQCMLENETAAGFGRDGAVLVIPDINGGTTGTVASKDAKSQTRF